MSTRSILAAFACTLAATLPAAQRTAALPAAVHGVDLGGMDTSVAPGDDFFSFANGTWYKGTQIPPDRASAGVWSTLAEEAAAQTHELLDHAASTPGAPDSDERKVADYYASYMDEAGIEAKKLAPLSGFRQAIAAIGDRRALTKYICGELRTDVDALNSTNFQTDHVFGLWIAQDLNEPDRYVPYILQGGLGMPDREYYTEQSPDMDKIRTSYRAHIAATLKLAGIADAEKEAADVMALEQQIAAVHATRTDSADVLKANNPWPRDEFSRRAPGIDWPACFEAAGLQGAPHFIVWHPGAVTGISALVGSVPLDTWREYLTFHLIDRYGGVLPKAFVDERFAFYGKQLSGTPQLRERWKRAVDSTNAALGDEVGKMYVRRFFAADAKAQLHTIVANIVAAFGRRIDALTWMNPKTKTNA